MPKQQVTKLQKKQRERERERRKKEEEEPATGKDAALCSFVSIIISINQVNDKKGEEINGPFAHDM